MSILIGNSVGLNGSAVAREFPGNQQLDREPKGVFSTARKIRNTKFIWLVEPEWKSAGYGIYRRLSLRFSLAMDASFQCHGN